MSSGEARHIELQGGLAGLVPLFTSMTSMQAISLGAIVPEHRPAAGETVLITTKKRYEALAATGKLNRGTRKTIARTKLLVTYAEGRPAALLFDFDTKGMPAAIGARIAGGRRRLEPARRGATVPQGYRAGRARLDQRRPDRSERAAVRRLGRRAFLSADPRRQ